MRVFSAAIVATRQPEVRQLHHAVAGEQQVGRLQVLSPPPPPTTYPNVYPVTHARVIHATLQIECRYAVTIASLRLEGRGYSIAQEGGSTTV